MTGRERGGPTQHEQLGASQTFSLSPKGFLREGQGSPSGRRHDTPQRYHFAKGMTVQILSWSRRGQNSKPIWGYFKCRAPFSCPFQIHHPKGYPKPLKTPRCIYTGTCNQQGKQPLSW